MIIQDTSDCFDHQDNNPNTNYQPNVDMPGFCWHYSINTSTCV